MLTDTVTNEDPTTAAQAVVVGEARSFMAGRVTSDDEVLAVVRKFLKGIDETLSILTPVVMSVEKSADAISKAMSEKAALEVYLPVQMTAEMIEAFARDRISAGADLGAVMSALKAERAGQYDGKLASEIVRGLVAGVAVSG